MPPVAAIDCGTNSTRLLVLDDDGVARCREMRITRLGQGVDATGELRADAIARTLDVLGDYRRAMDGFGVTKGRLAATSAARDARNGQTFLDAAAAATGLGAEILSGEEEGRLSFEGATGDLGERQGRAVVLDIGGGSTELVALRDGRLRAHSMQVGCVRVTERTLHDDPPDAIELAEAAAMVDAGLDVALRELGELGPDPLVVGVAGTVSTLAMLDQHLAAYDFDKLHHHWLGLDAIDEWRRVLAAEPIAERARRTGMVPGREDVIVGGLVILERAVRRLGASGCLHSERDILDGLAQSVLGAA